MTTLLASRPKAKPGRKPQAVEPAQSAPLEPALFRLVKALQELSEMSRNGNPPIAPTGEDFDGHDEDDEHFYYWLNLPDHDGPDIDLNLHGKTLMIRFDKPDRGS